MKVLITGATGFIGSHLIPRLNLINNCQLIAAIRNQDSQPKLSTTVKTIIVGEIDGDTDWSQALIGIDAVIHLAARAHILQEQVPDPEAEFIRVNTQGTANLVQQSIQAGVKHFIFISSIGAVATLSNQILTEETPPQPDTAYGRSKLKAEQALIELASNTNMTWTILRPTLVYGAGNPGNMASLLKLVKSGLPLPLKSVKNRRSFLYVGNLVDAIAICLTNPHAKNQLFLISDTQALSTLELIEQIANSLNTRSILIPVSPMVLKFLGYLGDLITYIIKRKLPINSVIINRLLGSLVVDSNYLYKTLNWQPPYTIKQGIAQGLL
ncbi:UDP-N-acetylglucosamine 4-epimerase [Stanieria cyanosphaera PCC 7437]|uniref:UDP-N-acetylglucosamine 4-epimerase n=1 Tax=Stanieria cyanosphaera (strain ATCC 29371 / PCC 7437) TaxID=111780 RepID=K9XYG9_STAC7|nr:NAD-dependent epimerase/dehydratase family protein [Stanieria cyanosphaera]AFZ37650.1 UDP-N-acetylglucosamine 4-epimerase [Stanieria cyanosphaera PCC 7437]